MKRDAPSLSLQKDLKSSTLIITSPFEGHPRMKEPHFKNSFYPDLVVLLEITFASDYVTKNHNCLFDIYLRAEIWCQKCRNRMEDEQRPMRKSLERQQWAVYCLHM